MHLGHFISSFKACTTVLCSYTGYVYKNKVKKDRNIFKIPALLCNKHDINSKTENSKLILRNSWVLTIEESELFFSIPVLRIYNNWGPDNITLFAEIVNNKEIHQSQISLISWFSGWFRTLLCRKIRTKYSTNVED